MTVLLVPFGIFVLFFIVHAVFVVYHLLHFAVYPEQGRFLGIAITTVSIMLLILAIVLLTRIDWNASFAINFNGGLL